MKIQRVFMKEQLKLLTEKSLHWIKAFDWINVYVIFNHEVPRYSKIALLSSLNKNNDACYEKKSKLNMNLEDIVLVLLITNENITFPFSKKNIFSI